MSRELMPKSGIMMPHVVVTRDAAVVGVSTVDGVAGAIDLTDKYLQKSDASATYLTKTDGATKAYVTEAIEPVMEGALFKADPFVANDVPFRSEGANGVESVDMIKVTPENAIKIGSYASSVQGVEVHSAGRLQVVDLDDGGVETKYPIYSKRYRPEIEEMPFAAIGSYVKDSKGRTIGVTRTGINSDIKQFTEKVTFSEPVTVADAVGDYDAVTLRQLRNSSGGSGGPTMSGISNFGIGDFHLRDSRAFIPAFEVVSDGQLLSRTQYPDLWAYAQLLTPITDADWLASPSKRGRYSLGDGSTTFRVPDRNGVQSGSISELFARGDGGSSGSNGDVFENGAPDITGSLAVYTYQSATGSGPFVFSSQNNQALNISTPSSETRFGTYSFAANKSSPAYGRSSKVRPDSFVGVWTIRANGGFVAANTSWSVINGDTTKPNTGLTVDGGRLISKYQVNGIDEAVVSLRARAEMGGTYYARLAIENVTSSNIALMDFNENGDMTVPRNLTLSGGRADISGTVTTRAGYVYLVGTGSASSSFVSFRNNANTLDLGRVYSERSGDITIQTTVNGATGTQKYFQFLQAGNAVCPGGWGTSSDERIKQDIFRIEKPLEKMKEIKGVSWKLKTVGGKTGYGFVAQDVEKSFPEAITITGDTELEDGTIVEDTKAVDTYGVAAALHHEAILALLERIEKLEAQLAAK